MAILNQFLSKVVVQIVNPIILLLATGAFVVFLWGVFEFIRNAGDAGKRDEGKRAIIWGLVGLVIIFGAYGILNIALGTFGLTPVTPGSLTSGA
jgi:type VI protein secretion system component VasK